MRQDIIDWLLDGDPAIRWQAMRDLLDRPAEAWLSERARTAIEGWGSELSARQDHGGTWAGGVYGPKWTGTTYAMLLLRDIGIPADNVQVRAGARIVIDRLLVPASCARFTERLLDSDDCVAGMILSLASVYGEHDNRLDAIAAHLIAVQMPDGGWNCARKRGATHSSVHTTLNVLDGLHDYSDLVAIPESVAMEEAVRRAHAFLLHHHLYQSHRTGAPMQNAFTLLSFPPRWHFDILRGLDHFQRVGSVRDERLSDAIASLRKRQLKNGAWPLQNRHIGPTHFQMERVGKPSRWNTLRALRVLRWWDSQRERSDRAAATCSGDRV